MPHTWVRERERKVFAIVGVSGDPPNNLNAGFNVLLGTTQTKGLMYAHCYGRGLRATVEANECHDLQRSNLETALRLGRV